MIRALYTAASGMAAQQANIDTVANNLANVNTAGFKKSRMEFEDLVYQQITVPGSDTSTSADVAPVGLEIGLGTRPIATARDFSTGNLKATNGPLDIGLQGAGFFQITMPSGETGYTRAGAFHLSSDGLLVTSEGYQVQPGITIPKDATSVSISKDGVVSVQIAGQTSTQQVGTLELGDVPEPGRPARARWKHVCRDDRSRATPTTGAPGSEGIRHADAGLPRRLERQRGRGDGQHDPRPARVRSQLARREGRR